MGTFLTDLLRGPDRRSVDRHTETPNGIHCRRIHPTAARLGVHTHKQFHLVLGGECGQNECVDDLSYEIRVGGLALEYSQ